MRKLISPILGLALLLAAIWAVSVGVAATEQIRAGFAPLTPVVGYDFEDGTVDGWTVNTNTLTTTFGLTNTTSQHYSGTHSLQANIHDTSANTITLSAVDVPNVSTGNVITAHVQLRSGSVVLAAEAALGAIDANGNPHFGAPVSLTTNQWATITIVFTNGVALPLQELGVGVGVGRIPFFTFDGSYYVDDVEWDTVVFPTATPTTLPTDTSTPLPSDTPLLPTITPLPPTDTPTQTGTPLPPTDTPLPPTNTPAATNTPGGPTDTPLATNTPTPTTTPAGCTDVYEPDNDLLSASLLVTGQSQDHSFCTSPDNPNNDNDWVKVNLFADNVYDFHTYNLGANVDTIMVLYDSAGNFITQDDNGGGGLASRIVYTPTTPGSYYLQLVNKSSLGGFGPGYQYSLGAAELGQATPTPTDCPNPFVDTNGNIFYPAIHYLNCRGVVNGTDASHYSPGGTSTRGQFAKVVVLGFGTPLYTPATQDFVDVPPSYFAYTFIESGYHVGILSGFDPGTCTSHGLGNPCYLPNLPITRGQLTKLVVNAGGYQLYTPGSGQDFTDVPPSNVFYASIETAYHNSIINGYSDHTFRPNNNIRRDEMAQIVYEGIVHKP